MKNGVVSVIITTFERPFGLLLRAVNSVRLQTYSNIEIIVIDDSHDSYKERDLVAKGLEELGDARIVYVRHEKNKGACAARNTGIRRASGEYIALLDDDDEWMPNKLERQLKLFSNKDVGLVYCSYIEINEQTSKETLMPLTRQYRGNVFDHLILENFIGSNSFVLLKRECFDKCGFFNEQIKASQDLEMWLRVSQHYKVDYVKEPLVKYYVHSGERITTNIERKIQGCKMINEIYKDYLSTHRKAKAIRLSSLLLYYKKGNYKQDMLRTFFEVLKITPFWLYRNVGNILIMIRR